MASLSLQANGDNGPLGNNWMTSFLQRQTNVHTVVGRSIEAVRATAGNQETIRSFFEVFSQTVRRLNTKTENIWNMDETGLALGACSNSRVLSSSLKHKVYVKSPNTREWVSITETASASGRRLRPAVIFKGQSLQTSWFPLQSLPGWLYTTSENGWTSNSVGLAWLRQIFIPESTPTQYDYRLLLLDGHGSHADVEFMWTNYQNKIACLYLPAHTSHILQPLDLAPFSVVKSKYRQEIQTLASIDNAAPVKKERFITSYNKARIEGLSGRVIRAGWRASGLCPYNPELVLQSTHVQARRAATPPPIPPNNLSHEVPMTPKRSQDLYRSQKLLERDVNLGRSTRYLLAKAGKAISRGNTEIAQLRASNARLQAHLDQHRINKPKK
ncbi:hypothetical protein K3495_g12078 [Podosphaera aphanis]|nr:hypothetical protein K3495_g12078 [Podosphaera aphanis]